MVPTCLQYSPTKSLRSRCCYRFHLICFERRFHVFGRQPVNDQICTMPPPRIYHGECPGWQQQPRWHEDINIAATPLARLQLSTQRLAHFAHVPSVFWYRRPTVVQRACCRILFIFVDFIRNTGTSQSRMKRNGVSGFNTRLRRLPCLIVAGCVRKHATAN